MQQVATARMAIEPPRPDLEALTKTCMDLKQAVEQMQGRYHEPGFGYRARMTVQQQPPQIELDGEFWLSTGLSNVLSVAYGGKWFKVGALTP